MKPPPNFHFIIPPYHVHNRPPGGTPLCSAKGALEHAAAHSLKLSIRSFYLSLLIFLLKEKDGICTYFKPYFSGISNGARNETANFGCCVCFNLRMYVIVRPNEIRNINMFSLDKVGKGENMRLRDVLLFLVPRNFE